MIRCDTKEERQALKDLTFAVLKVIQPQTRGETRQAMGQLEYAYNKLADTVIGMAPRGR